MIVSYEKDRFIISAPVTFPVGSPVTTLVGGSASATLKSEKTGEIFNATCAIIAETIVASWTENTLDKGLYRLQARAVSASGIPATLLEETVQIKDSN